MNPPFLDLRRIAGDDDPLFLEGFRYQATGADYGIIRNGYTLANGHLPPAPDMRSDLDILVRIQNHSFTVRDSMPICRRDIDGIGEKTVAANPNGRMVTDIELGPRPWVSVDVNPVFKFNPASASIKTKRGPMQRTI